MNINAQLEPERFYHIYNRGINGETLFKQERNYSNFLTKYSLFLSPVVDTFAYCLLKNHFHLLIRIKDQIALNKFYTENFAGSNNYQSEGLHNAYFVVSKQFARLFSSFTQAINKSVIRTGSLVESPFKRIEIKNDGYLSKLVWYINHNPQKHGFVKDFTDYPHSSYQSHLQTKTTKLTREELLSSFGGPHAYRDIHNSQKSDIDIKDLLIEFD